MSTSLVQFYPSAAPVSPQIPSDNVPFNELPDMKAAEITAAGKEALKSKKFDMIRINYANPDMVRQSTVVGAASQCAELTVFSFRRKRSSGYA